jgi:hypothetical protein
MRPLRAITKFPQLRFLVVLLLQSIPMLSNVIGLCCFIFFVFGILGVQLFQGTLRGTCFNLEDGLNLPLMCTLGGGASECPKNYQCLLQFENPNRGVIHFDSIGGAIVTIFQIMTIEGWTDIMYMMQDVASEYVFIYFVILIFVGPIFAIQLFLVVISNKFAQTKESLKNLEVAKVAELEEANKPALHSMDGKNNANNKGSTMDIEHHGNNKVADNYGEHTDKINNGGAGSNQHGGTGGSKRSSTLGDSSHHGQNGTDAHKKDAEQCDTQRNLRSHTSHTSSHTHVSINGDGQVSVESGGTTGGQSHEGTEGGRRRSSQVRQPGSKKKNLKKGNVGGWRGVLWKVKELAYSEYLANSILAVIVINFIFMAIDHNCDVCTQEYCAKFKAALEISNVFFAAIFLMEMVIKVF